MADRSRNGGWVSWTALFPPAKGLPGDPFDHDNPFTLRNYLVRATELLRALLFGVETRVVRQHSFFGQRSEIGHADERSPGVINSSIAALLKAGVLTGAAALAEAVALVESALRWLPELPGTRVLRLLEMAGVATRDSLEAFVENDDESRCKWEIIDLVVAILVGTVKFGLLGPARARRDRRV